MGNDKWLDFVVEVLFFGLPPTVFLVGLIFVGKESPKDYRFFRLGKNDPFRSILHDDNGEVREGVRAVAVLTLATICSVFIVIRILYGK